jgi:hypothetical protein
MSATIDTLTGFALTVEIGDWERVTGASIGARLGLVPTESSSPTLAGSREGGRRSHFMPRHNYRSSTNLRLPKIVCRGFLAVRSTGACRRRSGSRRRQRLGGVVNEYGPAT